MPYLVPAWALSTMGMSTMLFPRKIVSTACHQFMPSAISDEANMYVGMQADIEIHKAAMSLMPHLRWAHVVGAMSGLRNAESASSSFNSWISGMTSWVLFSLTKDMMLSCLPIEPDDLI